MFVERLSGKDMMDLVDDWGAVKIPETFRLLTEGQELERKGYVSYTLKHEN